MARISAAAAVIALIVLAALHLVSPEFNPAWRMVSEYALGHYSWLLAVMFLTWAASCVALSFALRPHIRSRGGKIGLVFLLAATVSLIMAAKYDVSQSLHALASLIGIPSLTIAAILVSVSLSRNREWAAARRLLLGTGNLPWVCLVLMVATMFIGLSATGGKMGPEVPIGWPNRLCFVSWGVWLVATAWQTNKLSRQSS